MSSNRDFANYMANWQQQSAAQRAEFERKIKADEAEFEALARLRTQRIAAEEIRRINEAQLPPEPAKKPLRRIRAPSGKIYIAEYDD